MFESGSSTADYWDRAAGRRRFSHPLDAAAFTAGVPRTARVLDLGCGYGRLLCELEGLGYRNLVGVDHSPGMLEQSRRACPGAQLVGAPLDRLPFEDECFGAVLLFAVLTCVPDDELQRRAVAEVARVLAPGGRLFLSDLPLQDDPRNRARYRRDAERFGTYGVFDSDDGTVFRHHAGSWLDRLTADFELVVERRVSTVTMRGNPVEVLQRELRRPGPTPLA